MAEGLARACILGLCAFDDDDVAPVCAAYLAAYGHAFAVPGVRRAQIRTGPPGV